MIGSKRKSDQADLIESEREAKKSKPQLEDYVLIVTNSDYGECSDTVHFLLKNELFKEYEMLFDMLDESNDDSDFSPLTKTQINALVHLNAINRVIAEIKLKCKKHGGDSDDEEEEEEEKSSSVFDDDMNAVYLWFKVIDHWFKNEEAIILTSDETIKVPLNLTKFKEMVFYF
jgi:hypothetical protein